MAHNGNKSLGERRGHSTFLVSFGGRDCGHAAYGSCRGWWNVLSRAESWQCAAQVFRKADDYAACWRLFPIGVERLPLRMVGFCLMPNQFQLVLWPHEDGDLAYNKLSKSSRIFRISARWSKPSSGVMSTESARS